MTYRLDWATADIDGRTTVTDGSDTLGVTVSTPKAADGRSWHVADIPGDHDALRSDCATDETVVEVHFDAPVCGVSFEIYDVDSGDCWDDNVKVVALDADGNEVPVHFTHTEAWHHVNGNEIEAEGSGGAGVDGPGAADSVMVHVDAAIVSLKIIHSPGDDFAQAGTIGLSELCFTAAPPVSDGIVSGTDGDDLIDLAYTGDPDGDMIDAGDAILPGAAPDDDLVLAGDGNDTVVGVEGDDDLYGEAGDDKMSGDAGNDLLDGGTGNDTLGGADGDDVVRGGAGNDQLAGGTGDDVLQGDEGDDLLIGNEGEDTLFGGEGADTMFGSDENDVLDGGAGDDSGTGGGGDDVVIGGTGRDTLSGGDGNDTVEGGADDDRLSGAAGDDVVKGGDGNDDVSGGSGDDLLEGNAGDDTLTGGSGSDVVIGGSGADSIVAGIDGRPDLGYGTLIAPDADPFDDRDTVDGGEGDDFISTGDDEDVIVGGTGADTIDAGLDADAVDAGEGDDSVIGGEGSDVIFGGAGNDTLWGGLGTNALDALNLPDDGSGPFGPDLEPDNGRDVVDGGAGDDVIYGEDDDDTLSGGTGADFLDGGIDDDEVAGGDGADTIIGGQGIDLLMGGADEDLFLVGAPGEGSGDVVLGGDDATTGTDFDTLDLRGSGPLRVVDVETDSDGNGIDGRVEFLDGSGGVTGSMRFENIEEVIPCFTPGTRIATPRGEVPVESLTAGDQVITRDNGVQTVCWVGHKRIGSGQLAALPWLRPVVIRAGALGGGLPERDMVVSPNHRVLVADDRNAIHFDEREVLVAAKHLVDGERVLRGPAEPTTYVHFMFERHEVVLSDGAWTESFQPGDYSLKGIDDDQRAEIMAVFPELRSTEGREAYAAARKTLKKHEALLLAR